MVGVLGPNPSVDTFLTPDDHSVVWRFLYGYEESPYLQSGTGIPIFFELFFRIRFRCPCGRGYL